MIDPTYLSFLRGTIRAEMLLTMVQLEQRCPGWWPSQADLAEDLGLCSDTLTRNIYRLMRKGLVGASTNVNAQGAWVYWVKRSADDRLDPNLAPAYVLRDRSRRLLERLPLDQCKDWARRHRIPWRTMLSFLGGHQKVLRRRWEVASGPHTQHLEGGDSDPP